MDTPGEWKGKEKRNNLELEDSYRQSKQPGREEKSLGVGGTIIKELRPCHQSLRKRGERSQDKKVFRQQQILPEWAEDPQLQIPKTESRIQYSHRIPRQCTSLAGVYKLWTKKMS